MADYEASITYGISAPKNTPSEIIDMLNKNINVALADPKMKTRFADLGGTPLALSRADCVKLIAADAEHGVATVAELRDNFTTIIAPRLAALAAANRQPVAERAWDWLQSLFTTTAPLGSAGDRNAALITLAVRSLAQGQLEAAVHQLVLLEDDAALVAADWLKNASARLAADKTIATVMSQALDQLAASN